MALRKVKKTIVEGAILVAHYGRDLSDKNTATSSYEQWGQTVVLTPVYPDSHLEIVVTGSAYSASNAATGARYGNAKFVVNGQDEYLFRGIIGGNPSRSGDHTHQNQQFGENNGRQNWRYYGSGNSIYMNHIHSPGTINRQEIQVWVNVDSSSHQINFTGGYMTVAEIASEGYNRT
jgi:hypothetical protein